MTLELYIAYVAATLVVLAIPGPTILLVISYALSHGRKSAGACVLGVALGMQLQPQPRCLASAQFLPPLPPPSRH